LPKRFNTEALTGKAGQVKYLNMFEPLNKFFDKIYVITLQRAADRHLHIQKELAGLNYTLMYGVDKLNINIGELIQHKDYDEALALKQHPMSKKMRTGEIGCSLSHRMVYQDVLKNHYQRVLILEDDVVIDKKNISLFETIAAELPSDWQLWYLGFAKNETPPANATVKKLFYHLCYSLGLKSKLNHTVINNLYPVRYSAHLQKAGFHDCTHAYAISNEAAKILLKQQSPVQYTADNLLAFTVTNEMLRSFISVPRLINQQYQVDNVHATSYLNA
jgi:glycosyl transferase family 25